MPKVKKDKDKDKEKVRLVSVEYSVTLVELVPLFC